MISSNVVLTKEHLADTVKYFLGKDYFVFDVETTGKNRGVPQVNTVKWMGLSTDAMTVSIPMGHPNGDVMLAPATRKKNPVTKKFDVFPARWDAPPAQLRPSQVFEALYPLFFSDRYKTAHNGPFDFISVAKYFDYRLPPPPYNDTIVMAWLVDENRRLGLKDITLAEYKRKYDRDNTGRMVEIHPFSKVARYVYQDAQYTKLHLKNLLVDLHEEGVYDLYRDLEMPVLEVLLKMGMVGTTIDVEAMKALQVDLSAREVESEGEVYRAAGYKLNLNSPKQKVDALYGPKDKGGQGLKPWRLTKGGLKKQRANEEITLYDYSTDKEALERWPTNKLVSKLLEYQEVSRVLGTYVNGYLGDEENPTQIFNGRVYPEFVQYGTVTGRFSCRAPNLQNIPRPNTELGRKVRGLFIAPPGYVLVVADYGQVELVVLAHYVGYGALYDGFFQGIDPHTMTASLVFNEPVENVNPDRRQDAKNINFAVVYGAGTSKVASMSKTTERRAKAFLSKHQRQFPEIYEFKDQVVQTCRDRDHPHIKTLLGRKRRLPTIWASDYGVRGKAERQAVNSLIQGSSADLIKRAMIRVDRLLTDSGIEANLILTVHDELVTQCREEDAEKCAALVREGMTGEGIQQLVKVPLSIDLKIVTKWSDAK